MQPRYRGQGLGAHAHIARASTIFRLRHPATHHTPQPPPWRRAASGCLLRIATAGGWRGAQRAGCCGQAGPRCRLTLSSPDTRRRQPARLPIETSSSSPQAVISVEQPRRLARGHRRVSPGHRDAGEGGAEGSSGWREEGRGYPSCTVQSRVTGQMGTEA